jgi:hypothetical protein
MARGEVSAARMIISAVPRLRVFVAGCGLGLFNNMK